MDLLTLGTIYSREASPPSQKVSYFVKTNEDTDALPSVLMSEVCTLPQLNFPKQKVTHSIMRNWPHLADPHIPEVDSKDVTFLLEIYWRLFRNVRYESDHLENLLPYGLRLVGTELFCQKPCCIGESSRYKPT